MPEPAAESAYTPEISTEEQELFLDAIGTMPASGIALRGDPANWAQDLQSGLYSPEKNFIVFRPPLLRPKIWGREAEGLYHQLHSALNMALVYADPWYMTGAKSRINDPDFSTYTDFFARNPDKRLAITWFTEAQEGQFDRVHREGRTWWDYDIGHRTGDVESFGSIPAEKVKPTIILDNKDVELVQEQIMSRLLRQEPLDDDSPRKKVLKRIMARLFPNRNDSTLKRQQRSLRDTREELRSHLARTATMKLCNQISDIYKSTQ